MPTQPPHHVSSQESQNPDSPKVYPGAPGICRNAIMRNEPNLPYGHGMPCPYNTKRTQFQPGPRPKCTKQTQFQPWRTCGGPKKCETNPITPPAKMRNEPNLPPRPPCPTPIKAKRTQLPHRRLIWRPVLLGRKSMLDRGSIFVYKVINKGLMDTLGGRSSVVEHQLPKREIRFYSALNPCRHSTYKPEFCLFYEFYKNSTHYTLSSDCSHIHDIVVLDAGLTLGWA